MDELLQLIRSCTQDLRHAQTNQMKAVEPQILFQLVLRFFGKIQKTNMSKETNIKSLFPPLKQCFRQANFRAAHNPKKGTQFSPKKKMNSKNFEKNFFLRIF